MNRRIFKEQTSAEGSVPFYKIGTFGGEPDAFISDELYQDYKEHFPYPKVGDILLSASGSIGKMIEYKGEKAYFQDSNIVWLDHDASVSNAFLKCFYSVVKWAGLEGSTIKRLYNKNILETQIALPSYAEQCLIGDFFEHIDNLVTLHQRKQNDLFFLILGKKSSLVLANDWEQCKLGDIFERIVRKNVNNESSLPLTISAQDGLVDQITYFNNRVASRDVSNYYLVLNGEFAYNKSTSDGYPYGAVKRLDLYEKGVLSTLYIVFALKDDAKTDLDYMAVFFDTDRWHRGVAERAAEGARNHGLLNISAEDFFDIGISLPGSIDEQRKIGRILKRIDNLITLHQCKQAAFFDWKRCLYSKFDESKKTLAWEQRKLGDIVSVCSGKDYKHLNEGDIPVYGTGGYMLSVSEALSYFDDAIGIGRKGTIDKPYILKAPFWTVDTLFYAVPKEKTALDFVYCLFQIIDWKSKDESTGVPSLSKVAINSVDISIPKSEEQVRIGAVFFKIDNLITLHQRGEKINNRRQT